MKRISLSAVTLYWATIPPAPLASFGIGKALVLTTVVLMTVIDGLSIGALLTVVSTAESSGSVAIDDTVEFEGDDVNERNPLDGEEIEDEEALINQLFLPLITQ